MSGEIVVPSVGESITEVIIAEWLKPVGAWVDVDEPVVSIDTDKVSVEIPSPIAGFLRRIDKQDGDTAEVGDVIGLVEAGDKPADAKPSAAAAAPAAAAAAAAPAATAAAAPAAAAGPAAAAPAAAVMPAAARVLGEAGVSAAGVQGSGKGGRVLKEDAERVVSAQAASAAVSGGQAAKAPAVAAGARDEEVVPMTSLRRRIAARLVESQQSTATLTTFNEVDMTAIMALRKKHQDAFVAKYGIKLGFMSFFVKAAVDALRLVPEINAEIRGNDIVYKNYCDIGVAIGGGKGLVVPVIRNAERLSFAEIEATIADYGKRAMANKLGLEELSGGTFTVSNGGVYGSLMSTPILNPPQSGILGMHNIVERPVAVNGQVEIRPMMYIALSYDHRIVDGKG
ncbi:MAG: 2-oxoglutarate dehydrogenase complex dihydrolipoyllysine-residue succinyltransferase, partial [Pseudomonadota bacterium]